MQLRDDIAWAGKKDVCDLEIIPRKALIKSKNKLSCHSGESRNPVKTIVYWMPFFNGMTTKTLIQSFPR
jgi:hypothetical protein